MRRGITLRGMVSAFTLSALMFVPMGLWSFGIQPPGTVPAAAPPPSLALIQSKAELVTTQINIADVIEGRNRDYRGKWSVYGQLQLGVNLAEAAYGQVNHEKRECVLRLPQPHLIGSKIDHERSEELYIHWEAWVPVSSKQVLRDEVWKHADRKLQKLGSEAGYMERAKVEAERALEKLFDGLGWKVRVEWQSRWPPSGFAGGQAIPSSSPVKE